MPGLDEQFLKGFSETGLDLPAPHPGAQDDVGRGKEQAGGKVDRQTARPVARIKIKSPRQPDHRQGEDREDVPVTQRVADGLQPGHFQPRPGAGDVKLKGKRQTDERPKAKPQ